MKKNYVYLLILLLGTVVVTLLLSFLYRNDVEVVETSYAYDNLNKITAAEFEEYMIENPDTIIYISDKTNLDNNKFEKKLINKLEKLNLLENVIYIEKGEVVDSLEKKFKEDYSYKYNEKEIPVIIVISDGEIIQTVVVNEKSTVDTIINYEVFEW